MATSVKTKFAGLLRGLLRRLDDRSAPPPAASTPPPARTSPAASAVPLRTETAAARPPEASDSIELPLAAIVASLPMDLRAKVIAPPKPGTTIRLASETIISQLGFGAVKITFGELRQLAPGVFAPVGGELDNRPISLPLHEILPRLNPVLLARRAGQAATVAEEISGPFDGRGKGITFTTQPLKAPPVAKPAPEPEDELEGEPVPARIPFVPPAAPAPKPVPAAFTPPPRPSLPPQVPLTLPARQTAPGDFSSPAKPVNTGNGNGNGNGHGTPPGLPAVSLKFTATPAPAPTAPLRIAADAPTFLVALGDLAKTWPDAVQTEIAADHLGGARVPLAIAAVEPGLKRGRVIMSWKQLRMLAKPNSAASPHDALELELSLKVLAPAFLAAQQAAPGAQRKVAVSAEIPNLFFGFPQPAAEPVAAPEAKAADTNFFGQTTQGDTELRSKEPPATDFTSRQAHPKEVVERAVALPGVAGAVVALQDGLRVAGAVPADLNADTLAAFLPQIFERMNQSTRELRMGPLNNINFTVGPVPWKIFRVSSVYFAAFGRAGETLPTAQLAGLAAELDRKK